MDLQADIAVLELIHWQVTLDSTVCAEIVPLQAPLERSPAASAGLVHTPPAQVRCGLRLKRYYVYPGIVGDRCGLLLMVYARQDTSW
jgi:hypothetical protein